MQQAGVTPEQTAYIGDDSVDLPAFAVCGLSFAVGDAMDYVQNCADYVLQHHGGKGAFREMSDMIMQAQGTSDAYATARGFEKPLKIWHNSFTAIAILFIYKSLFFKFKRQLMRRD